MESQFSLLYPAEYTKSQDSGLTNFEFLEELKIHDLIMPITKKSLPWEANGNDISRYLTTNTEVIKYRLDIIEDLVKCPELCSAFETVLPKLIDIYELRRIKDNVSDVTASIYSVTELDMYISCVELMSECTGKLEHINSAGLKKFFEIIESVHSSNEYIQLKTESAKIINNILNIKSITIGVNLDAQLHPIEAGIISVNEERFRSGNIIDRIMRLDIKDDGFRCMTPLIPYGKNDSNSFTYATAVNKSIDTIFKSSVKGWGPVIRRFVYHNTEFLTCLIDDIRFLLGAVDMVKKLEKLGLPMCKPQVFEMQEKEFYSEGLYNPYVALRLSETSSEINIVQNNFEFDENGMIYIFTGPNQGGKSVHTYAVGITQALFQMGVFVPARKAKISPVDNIFTNFPAKEESTINKGRLGEECARLKQMLDEVTQFSLVLMDETLSSTSAIEATYIASEVITGLSLIGSKCLFATHLHDLSQKVDELNKNSNGVKIDNLVAEIDPSNNGVRTYKVKRTKPDGLSYAKNIAEKYGITLENIKKRSIV